MKRKAILFAMGLAITAAVHLAARSVAAMPQSYAATPAHGATLAGVVIGPDDKPVANASVSYQSSGGNAPHAVHTDSRGRFSIGKLHADNYDMRASSKGIFSEWEKNITVRPGQTKTVTLRLIYAKEMPKVTQAVKPQK
jgi:hypothetical protein